MSISRGTTEVGLLQMTGCGHLSNANLAKGELFCRRARMMGPDIALFPEEWSIGITLSDPTCDGERERWQAHAINSPFD